jgi:hypothetical protein
VIAEIINTFLLDIAAGRLEGLVERRVRRDHPEVRIENDKRLTRGFHDSFGIRESILKRLLGPFLPGNIDEGDHHTVNDALHGPVRQDPCHIPEAVAVPHHPLLQGERPQRLLYVFLQVRVVQLYGKVADRASDIG